jgi:hypothetical protein
MGLALKTMKTYGTKEKEVDYSNLNIRPAIANTSARMTDTIQG